MGATNQEGVMLSISPGRKIQVKVLALGETLPKSLPISLIAYRDGDIQDTAQPISAKYSEDGILEFEDVAPGEYGLLLYAALNSETRRYFLREVIVNGKD